MHSEFIRANTRLQPVPLVPHIRLHLADESLAIWRKTEEELGAMNIPPPYWAFAWAGGQALARYLADDCSAARGPVLDLGAGTGIAGIAAMRRGAEHVLAADIDVMALAAVDLNAAANDVSVETTSADLLAAPPGAFQTVLVGDLFYERPLAARVLAFIEAAQRNGGTVLVGDPRRNYFPADRFRQLAEYSVPVTRDLEDAEIKRTAVWTLA
jgi:predicted nicotinamide N-methyase